MPGERVAEASWGRKVSDFIIGSMKAIIALVGSLAVYLVSLPDVTPFVPEKFRPAVQLVIVAATGIATWYAKYRPITSGAHADDL